MTSPFPFPCASAAPNAKVCSFTQNLSVRGALFHTDLPLCEADAIELTLVMPAEITLAENMRVRCRGKVLRVLSSTVGTRSVVAVHLEGYEFLPEAEDGSSAFARISTLHEHHHEDEERRDRAQNSLAQFASALIRQTSSRRTRALITQIAYAVRNLIPWSPFQPAIF